jgi:hypothetical protein
MDVTISAGFSGRPYDLRMRVYSIENNVGGNYSRYRGDRYAYSRSGYGSFMFDCRTVDSWIAGHYAGGCYSLPFDSNGNAGGNDDYPGKTIGLGSYDTGAVGHDGNGSLWFTSRVRMLNASIFGSADTGDVGMNGDHLPRPPHAPTPVTIDQITTVSLRYIFSGNWDGGSPITSWQAQIATDPGFTQNVQTVNSSGTTTFSGLQPATTYYLRSRGNNAYWNGAWSSTLSAMTVPATSPGISPVTSLSGRSATVTLTPPAGGAPSKYTVQRRVQGGTTTESTDTTSNVLVVNGLTPGETYEWRASAWYGTYQSPVSAWVAVIQANPNTTPGDYFDGSTVAPPGADVSYSWTGTANNSTSRANGVGVKGWEALFPTEGSGWGQLQRVTGGIYGAFGARVVVTHDCGVTPGPFYTQGFEVNSTSWGWGWSYGNVGVITRTNAFPAHSGSYSLRYTDTFLADGRSDLFYDLYDNRPYYDEYGYYQITAWVYLVSGTDVTMKTDSFMGPTVTTSVKNQWVQLTFEELWTGSQAGLIFRATGPEGTALDMRVDDVQITRLVNPSGTATFRAVRAGQKNDATHRSAVLPGALYTGSVAMVLPRTQRIAAELTFVDGAGVTVGDPVLGPQTVVAPGSAFTAVVSGVAPEGAVGVVVREVDVEGTGWAPWLSGESYLVDGGQVTLAGPFPYFDGSFAPNGPYVYSWEGTAHDSISVRTTVEVPSTALIDPDCVVVPAPPRPPSVPNTCIDETGLWRREWYTVDATDVREWFDTIPTLTIRTAGLAERQVRIRYYANPFNRPLSALAQDDFCGEIIVSYLPADSVLTLDGITEMAWASVSGGESMSADHLLYGSGGLPAEWPVLECGIGYYITLDVPTENPEGNISLDFELVTRY